MLSAILLSLFFEEMDPSLKDYAHEEGQRMARPKHCSDGNITKKFSCPNKTRDDNDTFQNVI